MTDSNRCPTCGCELPPESGLCPECLLRQGLAENDSLAVELGDNVDDSGLPVTTPPAAFDPPAVEKLASLFPGLEIVRLLGHGGMGAVYQARQTKLDRLVALKIIRPESAGDPAFAERFLREARTLAKLSHPSIVGIHDFGEVEATGQSEENSTATLYYFVMEYVDGANLRQLIEAGELAPETAIGIVPQVCEALQFAHNQGVVHRDIKPENILVDSRGQVKIADFGLARLTDSSRRDQTLTATHQVMGTPRYMAPEQMEGSHDVDHRADIYSLGVVFYEMLTGQVPAGHFDPPSKKVQIDVRLDEVVLRSLAREPERRYQQVSEVKTDVELISQTASRSGSGAPGGEQSPPVPEPPNRTRHSDATVAVKPAPAQESGLPAWSANPDAEFSGKAIAAAVMILCGSILFPGLILNAQSAPDRELALFLTGMMSFMALMTAVAASALGRVAIDQIRRSDGKLRGLRLAFLDAVLCPTIAINVLATALTLFLASQTTTLANLYIGLGREFVQPLGIAFAGLLPAIVIIAQAAISFRILRTSWQQVSGPWPSEEELKNGPAHRFCWKAAGGMAVAILSVVLLMTMAATDGPAFLMESSIYTRGIVAVLCGTASCLIGRQALREIQASNGKLSGLALAFAATAVFPVMLLDTAILAGVFFAVRELAGLSTTGPQVHSAIVLSLPLWLIIDWFVLRRKWNQLREETQGADPMMPERTPIATIRFSTSRADELPRAIPFHFQGLGYRLVKSGESEWVFARGEKYSGLWSNDMRKFQTALTVRAESVGGITQVNCAWIVRTWGALYTKNEITRFEEEGRGLSDLLAGEDEELTAAAATADDFESGRVGTSSAGRTALGLLIFLGAISAAPFTLWLMMSSADKHEFGEGSNGQAGSASPSSSDHDSGRSEASSTAAAERNAKRNAELLIAATEGDLKTVRQLLSDGADPNAFGRVGGKPIDGRTPLMIAAAQGNAPMVALLLAMGAEAVTQDNRGQTALMHAAMNSHAAAIQAIFEICDQKFGNQIVFRNHLWTKAESTGSVFAREDVPAVPTQLRPIDINGLFIRSGEELQDSLGETALMKAAAAGDTESVRLLSGSGRHRDYEESRVLQICGMQDKKGRTAFMHAVLAGRKELIVRACHVESDFPKAGTNQLPSFCHTSVLALRDADGNSALDLASAGDAESVEAIRSGLSEVVAWADSKLAGGVYLTNLQIPLRQRADAFSALGHIDKAKADNEFKAELDRLDNPTLAGRIFALFESARQGNATLVKKQLAEKVDPNSRNPAGETPLMKAVESGDLQTVVVLIFRGADERAQDKRGLTPLMHAAATDQAEVVRLLLEMEQLHTDADLQFRLTRLDSELPLNTDFTRMRFSPDNGLKDRLGRTALFHSVLAECVECTLPLIRNFSSSQTRDKADYTPLMYAVEAKSFDFLKQVAEKDSWPVYAGSFRQPSSFFYGNGVTGEARVGDDTVLQYLEKNGATEAAKGLRSKILDIINQCTAKLEKPEKQSDSLEALTMRAKCYRELGMIEEAESDEEAARQVNATDQN